MTITEFLRARLDEDEQAAWAGIVPERFQATFTGTPLDPCTGWLRMIGSKQRQLNEYCASGEEVLGRIVAVYAAEYSDHPDYNPDWAPPRT